jgi:hypothetical protein
MEPLVEDNGPRTIYGGATDASYERGDTRTNHRLPTNDTRVGNADHMGIFASVKALTDTYF